MKNRFAGKVAVITGAASGIGRATALAFAREGASTVLADIDRTGGEDALRDAIACGGTAIFVEADVSEDTGASRIIDHSVSSFGGVDILHNNAGVSLYASVPDMREEDWDRVLATNLKSVYLCSRHAIPEMVKRGGGSIINTASAHAIASQPMMAAYAASKGGVMALTRSMAVDHAGQGLRINCVCPGPVDTPMIRSAARSFAMDSPEDAMKGWAAAHPSGRIGTADEVASAVLFLASAESSFINGAALSVDGGLIASLM